MKSFKTKTISVLNQKGGVGKTTSAVNIASFLAITETPVLIIDMDPQGNASTGLGVGNQKLTIYDLLINNKNINSAIQKTEIDFLEIIPSNSQLAGAEIELVSMFTRETILKQINQSKTQHEFNFFKDELLVKLNAKKRFLNDNTKNKIKDVVRPFWKEPLFQ